MVALSSRVTPRKAKHAQQIVGRSIRARKANRAINRSIERSAKADYAIGGDAREDPYGGASRPALWPANRGLVSPTPRDHPSTSGSEQPTSSRPRLSSYECRNLRERHDLTSMPPRGYVRSYVIFTALEIAPCSPLHRFLVDVSHESPEI